MPVTSIDSVLVRPWRNKVGEAALPITRIPQVGKFFKMIEAMFDRAEIDCRIEIIFRATDDGAQENECRTLLYDYLKKPSTKGARAIAGRLAAATGGVSGLGLLFLVCGTDKRGHRLLVARFPADQGVLAEERGQSLEVEFVERIFMKSSTAYKAATYTSPRMTTPFWRGRAIDKQIDGPQELSQYWIYDFLLSDLATTGAAGTRRLGNALQKAVRDTPSESVRRELISAAQLLPNQAGTRKSAKRLLETMGVSQEGVTAVQRAMGRSELMDESFQLNAEEFGRVATYKSVELDNGAMLLAETARFERVFEIQRVAEGRTRYSTEGEIVKERLRKSK